MNITHPPPNVVEQILDHPTGIDKVIELGLFNEHRFSFYFWAKWNIKLEKAPNLITFDWHQDLAYPEDKEKAELAKIELTKLEEVSFYSWNHLNLLNDNHILSAAYLDLINDIWVVCKQDNGFEERELIDFKGKKHKIMLFKTEKELYKSINEEEINSLFFDIDIDFFTVENSTSNDKDFYSYIKAGKMNKTFSIESDLIKWIFYRVEGITIALEPEHTGGIDKSIEFLRKLEDFWFSNSIGNNKCNWSKTVKQHNWRKHNEKANNHNFHNIK